MKRKKKFKQTEIGRIPEDWEVREVWEIGKVKTGKTPPTENKNFFKGEYPFIKIPDMIGGFYIKNTNETLSEKGKNHMESLMLPKNSVCVSCLATIGNIGITTKNSFTNQQINSIVPNEKIDYLFLYYYFKTKKEYLKNMSGGGSVYNNLSKSKFEKLKVVLPSLNEQKSIVKILSDLDEKIEVGRKMNEILEELGQTLFKRWFVDFEFPNEKRKPYKSSSSEMTESELGEIPEGWEIKELGDFIDVQKGLSYKGKFLVDNGGIPMANLGTFKPPGGFKPEGLKCYVGEYKDRNLVKPGDIIVANTDITQNADVLGSPSIIPRNIGSDKVLFTHHIFAIRHKEGSLTNYFLYFLLQSPDYRARSKGFATGTTVLAIPKEAILELQFVCSPDEIRKRFDSVVKPVFDRITLNSEQIESLSKTRDLILPKLMTGKIRVKL